jgi:alkylation response protein AidB-like acyl-CoA dehydrogenase
MDFTLTDEQRMIRNVARDFAEKVIGPRAAEIDRENKFPWDLFNKMVELGFTGLTFPEKYGGSGCSYIEKAIVVEEIAKKCATTAATLVIHMNISDAIYNFGTEDQKKKYLPQLCSGGKLGAFSLTEAGAGSDAGAARTTAILDESAGEYVINGTKCFCTGGNLADYIALFALTDPSKKLKGLSCIIVPKGAPGFSIGKIEEKMGLHGSETAELIFDNCRVPKENLVGVEGKGFNYAMNVLDGGRIVMGAQALGIAEGALDEAIKYSKQRVQFGKQIAEQQGIQWYIAEMAAKTEAAKWLVYHAAFLRASGQPHGKEAAIAKFFASENARFVTNLALQIHGGYGYMRDYPLERMYRDAKITELYEGTNEIHKMVISRYVLS